jgi:hypothetical protein
VPADAALRPAPALRAVLHRTLAHHPTRHGPKGLLYAAHADRMIGPLLIRCVPVEGAGGNMCVWQRRYSRLQAVDDEL